MRRGRAALELLRRTYEKWRVDGAPQIAAALTYYAFLSLAPLLVLLVGIPGSYLGATTVTERVYEQAYALAGPLGEQMVRELVAASQPSTMSVAASVLAVLIAFWGAMQMFRQLRIAFDRMWDIAPDVVPVGGVWVQLRWTLSALGRHNLAAFLMVLAVGGLLVVSLLLSSAVGVAARWIAPILGVGLPSLNVFETALSMGLVTVLFAVVYRYLPRVSVGWRDVWVGAVMTAALFMLGRILLGVYFTHVSIGSAYGAAGSAVALLIWADVSLQLVLFGAEFTNVWAHTYGTRAGVKPVIGALGDGQGHPVT